MQQDTNAKRKFKSLGQDDFNRIRELLKTRTPLELSQAGVCGYSTAYKVQRASGYGEYRQLIRAEREKFYESRKRVTPVYRPMPTGPVTPKPPVVGNSIRFVPPSKPIDGSPNSKVYGSPFRNESSTGYIRQSADVVDVKTGAAPVYQPQPRPVVEQKQVVKSSRKPRSEADEARSRNSDRSVEKDGIDSFEYVDMSKITTYRGGKAASTVIKREDIKELCRILRSGGILGEVNDALVEMGYGRRSLDQLVRIVARDKEGLEEFKQAYKDGQKVRDERYKALYHERGLKVSESREANIRNRIEQEREQVEEPVREPAQEPVEEPVQEHVEEEVKSIRPTVKAAVDVAYKKGHVSNNVKFVRKSSSYDVPFLLGVQATFLASKLAGVAPALPWYWVPAPLYFMIGVLFIKLALVGLSTVLAYMDYVKGEDE